MKSILVDINVVLDVLLDRQPHVRASSRAWAAIEGGAARGFLAAHAVTTIHYLIRRAVGSSKATKAIGALLTVFEIAPMDDRVIKRAMGLAFGDFEDAVSASAGQAAGCDYILTRDPKGFRSSPVPPITPEAVIPLLERD
jgi:predicted nucleic acid-binding protein